MDSPVEVNARIETAHYRTEISTNDHTLIADEPAVSGGEGTGPSPSEFLATALASCTAITLRMYADRKGWALKQANIKVVVSTDKEQKITRFDRTITLIGELSMMEKERLLEIANKCPVHQVLSNKIAINSQLTF